MSLEDKCVATHGRGALLIRELRESCPYLADEGWRQVADLLSAAADEIERLRAQVGETRNP